MTKLTFEQIRNNTNLLNRASQSGDFNQVKHLISVSDPKANHSLALRCAATQGHIECIKLLIPVSDPKANDSVALRMATLYGHIECVKLLIPVSDPKADNSQALQWAADCEHMEIIELLIPVSDYSFALQYMHANGTSTVRFEQCIEEYEALQQKDRLSNELQELVAHKKNSKKRNF